MFKPNFVLEIQDSNRCWNCMYNSQEFDEFGCVFCGAYDLWPEVARLWWLNAVQTAVIDFIIGYVWMHWLVRIKQPVQVEQTSNLSMEMRMNHFEWYAAISKWTKKMGLKLISAGFRCFFLVRNGEICCNLIDLPLIGERHEVRVNAIVD